jgi:hypothetical protein
MPNDPNPEASKPSALKPEERNIGSRPSPGTPASEARGMLPGMALIGMYLLVLSMLNAFAAASGKFGAGSAKYSVLAICTLIVVGVFGLLKLRRWGWAIVTAGCLLLSAGYFYAFHRAHIAPYIIQGLFALCFFLYLSRPEVRQRLR